VLIAAGLALLLVLPRNPGGDGRVRYEAIQAFVEGEIPQGRYSLVTPLLAVPLDLLGRAIGAEEALVYRFNGVLFTFGLLVIWLLLRGRVSSALIRRFLLVLVFGSMFPAAVVSLYGETTTAVLLAVGLLAVVTGDRPVVQSLGWGAAVLGAVNTPAILPAFVLVVVCFSIARRSAWPLIAIPAAVALVLLDLRLRTGGLTSPYADDHGFQTVLPFSGRPNFSYPALFGILAIVFSLGKGLIFYAPGLFVRTRDGLHGTVGLARTQLLWLILVAAMVAVYSRWWAWYGGVFYGPRFFLVASVPASLAVAARLRRGEQSLVAIGVSLGLLLLSMWVGVTSALGDRTPSVCTDDDYALEHLCWYSPEFSVLWRPLIFWPETSAAALGFAGGAAVAFARLALPVLLEVERHAVARLKSYLAEFRTGGGW
jgi:hypothetical protein